MNDTIKFLPQGNRYVCFHSEGSKSEIILFCFNFCPINNEAAYILQNYHHLSDVKSAFLAIIKLLPKAF